MLEHVVGLPVKLVELSFVLLQLLLLLVDLGARVAALKCLGTRCCVLACSPSVSCIATVVVGADLAVCTALVVALDRLEALLVRHNEVIVPGYALIVEAGTDELCWQCL